MEHDTKAPNSPAVAGLVERTVRPCAWTAHSWLASRNGGHFVPERRHAFDVPLYDQPALDDAATVGIRLGTVTERERVRALMMEMHERDKHRHNYWRCAVVELFGA